MLQEGLLPALAYHKSKPRPERTISPVIFGQMSEGRS